jgi:tetratricopeptide (TPR) repeat protein
MELKTLQRVSVAVKQHDYVLLVNGKDDKSMSTYSLAFRLESYPSSNWGRSGDPQALAKAQAYADALNLLSAHARGEDRAALDAEWSDFQQKAVAWRSLPTKPAVSDAVRMHRIGAEEALQQKQFDTAIDDYEAGLKIDPLWPEGHFNAAILDGELNDYEWAVWHMRAYLELLPDAPDAPAAHDQLLLWQGKLGQ